MNMLHYFLFALFFSLIACKETVLLTNSIISSDKTTGTHYELHFQVQVENFKSIQMKSMKNAAGEIIVQNQELKKKTDQEYTITLPKEQVAPGLYKIQIDITAASVISKNLNFKVTTESISIKECSILGEKVKYGDKIKEKKLISGSGDKFTMELVLQDSKAQKNIHVHQSFVQFINKDDSSISVFFPFKYDKSSKKLKLSVTIGSENKRFQYKSGKYDVHLVLGDSCVDKALLWNFGTVELMLGAAPPEMPSPLYTKPLLHDSDITLKALPEIYHVMRPQDKRPPVAVSNLFTLLVLSPLGGFLVFLNRMNVTLSKFPGGINAIWALGFLGSLGSILGLFYVYWLRLTMFQTLGYLFLLSLIALVFGHRALKYTASNKTNPSKKND